MPIEYEPEFSGSQDDDDDEELPDVPPNAGKARRTDRGEGRRRPVFRLCDLHHLFAEVPEMVTSHQEAATKGSNRPPVDESPALRGQDL